MSQPSFAFTAALAALLAGSPAAAQQGAAQASPAQPQAYDPNERICEEITLTGSRIAKKRFCGTRAEWEERRLRDRQEVERAQMSPCVVQRTSASGRASC